MLYVFIDIHSCKGKTISIIVTRSWGYGCGGVNHQGAWGILEIDGILLYLDGHTTICLSQNYIPKSIPKMMNFTECE